MKGFVHFTTLHGNLKMNGNEQKAFPVHVVKGMARQDWQGTWETRADHLNDPIFPGHAQPLCCFGEFGYSRIYAMKYKLTLPCVGKNDGKVHDMFEIRLQEKH